MEAKTKNIVLWAISGLLAAAFVAAGSVKLMDLDAAAAGFEAWGLPGGMALVVAVCEVAGGIGLLIPRLAGLAGWGLAILMIGAVTTHLINTPPAEALPALILGLLSVYVARSRGLPFGSSTA